ncbi:MAG: TetR/AcrR family transcriptional regulator [Microbacteriaceae bacterium]
MDRRTRTHTLLRSTAMGLFAERGYEATTTAQIAEHAGVSEMTLFRHFASKEALLLEDPFDPLMAAAVRARPDGEGAMRAVTQGIRETWSTMDVSELASLRWLLGVVAGTPSLRGALERSSEKTAAALAAALQDRGVTERESRVAAAAVIAGLSRALLDWSVRDQSDLSACVFSALDILGGH